MSDIEELSSEEQLILQWWKIFFEHIRKDLAYVWDEKSRANIEQLESHAEKIISILQRLKGHYSKDKEIYFLAIQNLELFCQHLRRIQSTREWVVNVHDDIFDALEQLNAIQSTVSTRRDFIHQVTSIAVLPKERKIQEIEKPYLSSHNKRRAIRRNTHFIILHTTEASDKSSLNSVYRSGTANYVVATDGSIFNTIEHTRIAKHAGRSMWNNISNISNVSVGIEVVGYHNKEITLPQYQSIRTLLNFLKLTYRISDNNVLTHSMVAYGSPNRYWRRSHRGRKRCGMQFAKPEVRERLGLKSKPVRDPDLIAGRLISADPYLFSVLYGTRQEAIKADEEISKPIPNVISPQRSAWLITRGNYDSQYTRYMFPDGQILFGDQLENQNLWGSIPNGTIVDMNVERQGVPKKPVDIIEDEEQEAFEGFKVLKQGDTAQSIAGEEYNRYTTIYFLLDGRVRTGAQIAPISFKVLVVPGVRVLLGYIYGGEVTSARLPRAIAGSTWNYPSTFYRFRNGTIRQGDEIDDNDLPRGTIVFFRR